MVSLPECLWKISIGVADFLGGDFDFFAGSDEAPDPFNKEYTIHTALFWEGGLRDVAGQFRDLEYGGWHYGGSRSATTEGAFSMDAARGR